MNKLQNIRKPLHSTRPNTSPAVIKRNQVEAPASGVWNGKQAAAYFGVCYRTFLRLAEREKFPYIQLGRLRLYSKDVLMNRLGLRINPAGETGGENY